jgi:hypothetical protein
MWLVYAYRHNETPLYYGVFQLLCGLILTAIILYYTTELQFTWPLERSGPCGSSEWSNSIRSLNGGSNIGAPISSVSLTTVFTLVGVGISTNLKKTLKIQLKTNTGVNETKCKNT